MLTDITLPVHRSISSRSTDARRALMEQRPSFGSVFTDHIVVGNYSPEDGWHGTAVVPFASFEMHPASQVLHYGQAIFEGLKAYRQPDGAVALFRPQMNARRFAASAARIAMPALPESIFLAALNTLVHAESDWVPSDHGASLYLRPMMFARDAVLLTKPSRTYTFAVLASPVWDYFARGVEPVSVWISTRYIRAARGGTGEAKAAGNYAAGFAAQAEANEHGCEQVVWLDAIDRRTIEEMGGMNLFFVVRDGPVTKVVTPKATGSLLMGVTRDSLLVLAHDLGYSVEERAISIDEWREGSRTRVITEVFACGTAAVIVPIGCAKSEGQADIVVNGGRPGAVTMQLREELLGIQHGRRADKHGWRAPVQAPNSHSSTLKPLGDEQ